MLPAPGGGRQHIFLGDAVVRDASSDFFEEKGRGRQARVVALDRSLRWGEGFSPSIF